MRRRETLTPTDLRRYANAEGDNVAKLDVDGAVVGGDGNDGTVGNFDAAGNLLIPMEKWDHDGDGGTTPEVLRLDAIDTTFGAVKGRLDLVNSAVEALVDLQDDNKNALLQPAIDEAVRRAQLEQSHYQAQFDSMVADTTNLDDTVDDQRTDDEAAAAAYSIKSRYAELKAAETARDNAGVELQTAFQAREAATAAVADAFTDPQAFYQQLVDRREYTKAQKEAEVIRLAGLTGDEAATEADTEAAAKAVTTAQEALDKATEAQAAFQGLVADDSPVKALVEELLKSDATGDDGGALVDTIVGAYDASAEATATANDAETASTVAGNAVAALTAVDDPDTADVDETGAVTANSNAIAALTGEGGEVGLNTAAIAANETAIGDLDGLLIAEENARIDGDAALGVRIDDEEAARMAGDTALGVRIDGEATAREMADTALGGRIDTNVEMIGTNVTNIANNATAIMAEQTARTEADTMLGGRIDTNAGDILTNAGDIVANEMSIGANADSISANTGSIAANMSSIGSNASAISDNRNMIGELSDDLSVVRAGVAASMALAGMPAINGRGISIGVGSFDGESAFAVGFQIQGEMASFKVGLTSGGGATGASAGVGFQF